MAVAEAMPGRRLHPLDGFAAPPLLPLVVLDVLLPAASLGPFSAPPSASSSVILVMSSSF